MTVADDMDSFPYPLERAAPDLCRFPNDYRVSMQFLVIGYDGTDDDAPARRQRVRQQHLALGDQMEAVGSRWYGASLRDEDGEMIGSFAVMDFRDRAGLDEWLEREPYVVGDVWRRVEVEICAVRDPWKFNRPREFFEERAR